MTPTPLYNPTTADAAYQLRYAWTGWPQAARFEQQPAHLINETALLWEQDGMRVLESRWTPEMVQILFSATPEIPPVFVAARAKGRLDHALRQAKHSLPFRRKVAVRTIGDNTRRDVEAYIERQVAKERFVDQEFAAVMAEFTVVNPHVDLSQPVESARGRYWYNLHLVLIVDGQARIRHLEVLRRIRDGCFHIAAKKRHVISRLSVVPDHLHAALRGNFDESPLQIAHAYLNNLAHVVNQGRIWREGFYTGTFGEYSTQAIRNLTAGASP